jgi:hypothetical protein
MLNPSAAARVSMRARPSWPPIVNASECPSSEPGAIELPWRRFAPKARSRLASSTPHSSKVWLQRPQEAAARRKTKTRGRFRPRDGRTDVTWEWGCVGAYAIQRAGLQGRSQTEDIRLVDRHTFDGRHGAVFLHGGRRMRRARNGTPQEYCADQGGRANRAFGRDARRRVRDRSAI